MHMSMTGMYQAHYDQQNLSVNILHWNFDERLHKHGSDSEMKK